MTTYENLFANVELQTSSNTDTSPKDVIMNDIPSMLSSEWHDYAMTLFHESEMVDGHPLVAGLRRVSEVVLGPIIFSGPTQVFPVQSESHHGRATVVFTVEFANGMRYAEVADSGKVILMICSVLLQLPLLAQEQKLELYARL